MSTTRLNATGIEAALEATAKALVYTGEVEILIVGGAAGLVTGVLPASRTTIDCDVMIYSPESAWTAVEVAAESVAQALGLPDNWLNSDVMLRADTLPEDWKVRRVLVGHYGKLLVYAISRLDLIAMKIVAGRVQDREDIETMKVRADEAAFVHRYLDTLGKRGTHQDQVDDARLLLASLKLQP